MKTTLIRISPLTRIHFRFQFFFCSLHGYLSFSSGRHATSGKRYTRQARYFNFSTKTTGGCQEAQSWTSQQAPGTSVCCICSWGDFKEVYVTRIAVLAQFCAKVITQCLYKVPLESYEEHIQQISTGITNHNEWWVIFADIALIKNLKKLSHCVALAWNWHCHLILNMLFPFWKLFISSFNFLL